MRNSRSLTPLSDAKEQLLSLASSPEAKVSVVLELALGRVLASDIIAPIDVPGYDNSSMDGFAISASDLEHQDHFCLVGTALAGQPFNGVLQSGEAVTITTGAAIPEGADMVVMLENSQTLEQVVKLNDTPTPGQFVRQRGQDIGKGSVVLEKGTRLSAPHISLLSSLGIQHVQAFKPITVGLLSTGDELIPAGQTLQVGELYDSNRPGLKALLSQTGANIIDYGIIADDPDAIEQTLTKANRECDLLVSSGGVSVGQADYIKQVLGRLGQIGFWKVAIKPGKPFACGTLTSSLFCGLPGNPVSSFVTALELVVPLICKMQGQILLPPTLLPAKAAKPINKSPGRMDFQRGMFYAQEIDGAPGLLAHSVGNQNSGVMSTFAHANCFIVLEQDRGKVTPGEWIQVLPFDRFLT